MTLIYSRCLFLVACAAYTCAIEGEQSGDGIVEVLEQYVISPFAIPADVHHIHLMDLDADSRVDMILEFGNELRVVHQGHQGFDFADYHFIPIPRELSMWDVGRLDGDIEDFSIFVIDSNSRLVVWELLDGVYQSTHIDVPIPALHLPEHTTRSRFCIDINGDSIDDLALPSTHFLHIIELGSDKLLGKSSKIRLLSTSRSSLSSPDISELIGQTYRAAGAVFKDINNDSHIDVVMQNENAVRIGLGNVAESNYFSSIPHYELNIEKDSTKISFDQIDFSNLFSLVRLAPNRVEVMDINQDGRADLTLLEPNRVVIFVADEDGIDTQRPTQILRFNQNTFVLSTLDLNFDGYVDLVAVKTPDDISVRRVLLALVLPTDLRFEFLGFHQSNGKFSRRPDRRVPVNLKVPALVPTLIRASNFESRASDNGVRVGVQLDLPEPVGERLPVLVAQLDDNRRMEVLSIQAGEVRVFFNALDEGFDVLERSQAEDIGTLMNAGSEFTLDVRDFLPPNTQTLTVLDLFSGVDPVVIHQIDSPPEWQDLLRFQLNDDELDDVLIFENGTSDAITGVVLLSRKR